MLGVLALRGVGPIGCRRANRPRGTSIDVLGAEEAGDVRRRRAPKEVGGVAGLKNAAFVEQNRDVADETSFGKIVGDVQDGTLTLEVDRPDLSPNGCPAPRVEGGEGLVEQEILGPAR